MLCLKRKGHQPVTILAAFLRVDLRFSLEKIDITVLKKISIEIFGIIIYLLIYCAVGTASIHNPRFY